MSTSIERKRLKSQTMSNPRIHLEQVCRIPVLKSLSDSTRTTVASVLLQTAKESTLEKDEILYRGGDDAKNTGTLLVKGSMSVERDGESVTVKAPDLLGEMQQLNKTGQRVATVTALEESIVLEFAWHDFLYTSVAMKALTEDQQREFKEAIGDFVGRRLKVLSELTGESLEAPHADGE